MTGPDEWEAAGKEKPTDEAELAAALLCKRCWSVNGGPGDCSSIAGCHRKACSFCTNV